MRFQLLLELFHTRIAIFPLMSQDFTHDRNQSHPRGEISANTEGRVEKSRRDFLMRAFAVAGLTGLGSSILSQVAAAASSHQVNTIGSGTQLDASNPAEPLAEQSAPAMTVYKDPDCGCCTEWVKHVRKAGFAVTVRETRDTDTVKRSFGVPAALVSCHTAQVGSYVVEGHVPADLIKKLLQEKPVARGLAVPGMPVGSPGMEMGSRKDPYDVVLFEKSGKTSVYASR